MEPGALIAFNLALLAAWASPGPALLFALRTTLAEGRRAGITAGLGLAAVAAGWTLAALLGLDALFALFPAAFAAIKTLGALYLLWIAWKTWRGARTAVAPGAGGGRRAFRSAALINLGNPKAVLFSAAVLVVIFPAGLGGEAKALIALNHFVLEALAYAALALALGSPAVAARYLRAKVLLDRAAASLMAALGLRLLLDR